MAPLRTARSPAAAPANAHHDVAVAGVHRAVHNARVVDDAGHSERSYLQPRPLEHAVWVAKVVFPSQRLRAAVHVPCEMRPNSAPRLLPPAHVPGSAATISSTVAVELRRRTATPWQ